MKHTNSSTVILRPGTAISSLQGHASLPGGPIGDRRRQMDGDAGPSVSRLDKASLRPVECPGLTRWGRNSDGGYVIPAPLIKGCGLLISLGLSDEWSFEREFLSQNPEARLLAVDLTLDGLSIIRLALKDMTTILSALLLGRMAKLRDGLRRLHDHSGYFMLFRSPNVHLKRRVGADDGGVNISLASLLESHPSRAGVRDVLVKMDIEGTEYAVVPDVVRHHERIRCAIIEFHEVNRRVESFNQAIRNLCRYFAVVHVHGNNFGGYDPVNEFPDAVEVTLVHKSLLASPLRPWPLQFPRPGLDFPNCLGRADYALTFE